MVFVFFSLKILEFQIIQISVYNWIRTLNYREKLTNCSEYFSWKDFQLFT